MVRHRSYSHSFFRIFKDFKYISYTCNKKIIQPPKGWNKERMITMSKYAEYVEKDVEDVKVETPDLIQELTEALATASIEAQEAAIKAAIDTIQSITRREEKATAKAERKAEKAAKKAERKLNKCAARLESEEELRERLTESLAEAHQKLQAFKAED